MKKLLLLILLFFVLTSCSEVVLPQDDPAPAKEVVAEEKEAEEPVEEKAVKEEAPKISIGATVLKFLNTPMGITIVGSILAFILGKVFTKKPKWKALVIKYGPQIMQAVKFAEKNIDDNEENKALLRVNSALEYLIKLEPKLKGAGDSDLKAALSAVHASAEANNNLKKAAP